MRVLIKFNLDRASHMRPGETKLYDIVETPEEVTPLIKRYRRELPDFPVRVVE